MAFSDLERAMFYYILGRTLPKGTTRMAGKAILAAAIGTGRAAAPLAAGAAPTVGRALVNPYIGIPAAAITGTALLHKLWYHH